MWKIHSLQVSTVGRSGLGGQEGQVGFQDVVGNFLLDEFADLAQHVECSIANHRSWISDISTHDGQKCWQVPKRNI